MNYNKMTFNQLTEVIDRLQDELERKESELHAYKTKFGDMAQPSEPLHYDEEVPTFEDIQGLKNELPEWQKNEYFSAEEEARIAELESGDDMIF